MSESLIDTNERFFLCGITGSGKTTLAVSIYKKLDTFAVFINTQDEVAPEHASDLVVHTPEDLLSVLENIDQLKAKKVCLSPKRDTEIKPEDIEAVRDVLFAYGAKINEKRKAPIIWCHIFIDEIHEYSSKRQPNRKIDSLWKRGRRYGIIAVGLSQRPADVSHTILTQSKYHVIFKVSPYEYQYFHTYHIPIEDFEEWIKRDYHFVVFDGYEVKEAYPITP